MSAYEAAGGGATSRLVLNFGGLEYMNSGGIGMLVTLLSGPTGSTSSSPPTG